MNSATVNWEGRFQRVKSRLALWKARKLTLLGKVLVLKADMLSSVLHLACVFPLPVTIRRPLARTIFDFLWGGRYEWVALGRMMSGLAEGGRDVPDLPLKLDTIFVASLLQDMASEVGHPASIGMKYFFLYAARGILNWSNWLRAHPKALEDGIWKHQRVLYRVVRGKVNPSPLLGVPSSVTVGVQAFLHRTLPVRDKIHWHGLGRSPLCPRPSCGAGETAYHVMWECSFARQLWAKAKKVVGRAKPDLTLTWQVVERGFVGAHIRKKGAMAGKTGARTEWSGVEWNTERVAKGVEWEVTERMKLDVDKLGYHAAKEKWKGPVNSSGGTAQDFEVPVEEQRQGSDAKGFVLHQNHQGPVESDGSAPPRCSQFCCTQMLKVLKGFSTPLHSPAEAIRADASVRVTLVPGGGDLRVKLSQYTDDTTLLLDSDECVVRALEVLRIFEGSQELGSTLANVHACAQGGHALHYVFPLPVAIRRPLERTIFDFLWGGRYEWVALGRMMSGLAEGGRDVPDLPLKLDTIFVASLLQDMASEVGHPASIGMKYFFLYAARGILNWSNVGPRSEQLPWHYAWVAKWLRAHPEALEDGIWKQQRVLYRVVRGKVNPSPLLGVPSSVWVGVQAVGLSNGQKDLNWACLHRTLPVRDKIHRHGLGRSPLCPRPSCGAGETAYHVMWECSFTRQLWAKAKKVVGRAKPDLTLTWQVVERGFVGAHIRSGWGILWLLLSLYKRGLWLVIQELVRNGVEWSGVQRGWLRGSNQR
ncbi:hypothetical protein Q8A73_024217 [Channa argus]|nr:hypothetical protein Q8A73_024217 [Channa argus]